MDTLRPHFTKGFQSVSSGDVPIYFEHGEKTWRWSGRFLGWTCYQRLTDTSLQRSETRRQNPSHADLVRGSGERQCRGQELLFPDLPETTEKWNATEVAANGKLFPFTDDLTTFVFIVASDLGETQRERLTRILSFQVMDVATYSFKRVQVAFEELFCSPEGPIASRYYNLYRTFIIEDGSEVESGNSATDAVTGEQGYVDDKHSCFWSQDDNKSTWKSRPFKSRLLERRKEEGKENAEGKEKANSHKESSVSEFFSEEDRDNLWKLSDYSNCSDDSGSACRGTAEWHNSRYTAWMTSVLLGLAYHPTYVVLDLWLDTIDWIKKGNQEVPETCAAQWHYNNCLSLQ